MDESHKGSISAFVQSMKFTFNKCLDPSMQCQSKAIRAHSVQNSAALEYIAEKDHVYELRMRLSGGEPECLFTRIGRNSASTFTGFCGVHDTKIFAPIDTHPVNVRDREHLFLLAYRAVTRELHALMEGAWRFQRENYRQDRLLGQLGQPTMAGMAAVGYFYKSWSLWKYRARYFDRTFLSGRYDSIRHEYFVMDEEKSVIAASSSFSLPDDQKSEDVPVLILNIVPLSATHTAVIFSYARHDQRKARLLIKRVTTEKSLKRKINLSHLLLQHTENFFIRPSLVDSWSKEKRKHVEQSFISTIRDGAILAPSKELNLFLWGEN